MTPDILVVLPIGRSRAMTKKQLSAQLGITTREFEQQVEALRKSGRAGICSAKVGYWLPETVQELEQNVEARRRRIVSQALTVRGEKACVRRWKGGVQEELWAA
jgi:biotin operon repressor